ncbi:MAG: FadR/GntR family transcriptional regulator [Bacillota bacterium]|uniref:FCD domain-containing protein n=1 Tax=Thermanaerosceptrum fracticalcis TaxID=1712410 RepID=A0A7G6E774_THEFR|nr:FadR/GntR family transcriptional regulator [Thermanaerosceptrum fracticalcis]QNB47928.1 FCD domain-containing protein [Thermanaerosceptrum fracticalcis]
MDFKPIKTKKIYEEIVEQIRHLINSGNLAPGDKLLSERELSEQLKVSRASVREALSALEIMGLIEVRPGEGTFIRQTTVDSIIGPLALILSIEKDTVMELLEVRKILEVETAGLAAERGTPEEIEIMGESLKQMKLDLEQNKLGEEADHKFHFAIAVAAHNSILLRLMNTISDTMKQSLRTSRQRLYLTPGTPERLYKEHKGIYDAIAASNPRLARERMYDHLLGVEKQMMETIDFNK